MAIKSIILELQLLLPLEVSHSAKGYGSFITFDLCKKRKDKKKSFKKILHLWVYLCKWSLFDQKKQLLSCYDEDENLYTEVLTFLIGKTIIAIDELSLIGKIEITFNNGITLYLEKDLDSYHKDDNLLIAYIENGNTISYSFQKGFYIEK